MKIGNSSNWSSFARTSAHTSLSGKSEGFTNALSIARSEKLESRLQDLGSKFISEWSNLEAKSVELAASMPMQYRPYFESQMLVNQLSLKTQLVTKVGETGAGTIRRLQNFGS